MDPLTSLSVGSSTQLRSKHHQKASSENKNPAKTSTFSPGAVSYVPVLIVNKELSLLVA